MGLPFEILSDVLHNVALEDAAVFAFGVLLPLQLGLQQVASRACLELGSVLRNDELGVLVLLLLLELFVEAA